MKNQFYKIIKERPGFARLQLTKLGWVGDIVENVFTFKKDDDRYLLVQYRDVDDAESLKIIERIISGFGDLEKQDESRLDELELIFAACLAAETGTKYKVHYERERYRSAEHLAKNP